MTSRDDDISHIHSLVLIVGLSGAGKSSASGALSDFGYYAVDNLPAELLDDFLTLSKNSPNRFQQTCLLLDIDSRQSCEEVLQTFRRLSDTGADVRIIFLDCSREAITQRYSETRRPHPAFDREHDQTLSEGIQRERSRLQPIKEVAQLVVDTSDLNIHQLRRKLRHTVEEFSEAPAQKLRVNFLSFGFKYGAPSDCDLLVDVRFVKNPYFEQGLRRLTGLDQPVIDFVLGAEQTTAFLEQYSQLLRFLLPLYVTEGKSYLNIGVGCTGGRHRSVALAEVLKKRVLESSKQNYFVSVSHRDLNIS